MIFEDFFKGNLDLCRLNFAMLCLIPKVEEAKSMKNLELLVLLIAILQFSLKFLLLG